MSKLATLWQSTIDLLDDLTFLDYMMLLLTLTGLNIKVVIEWLSPKTQVPSLVAILTSTFLIGFLLVFFGGKRGVKQHYRFPESSAKEAMFFCHWYQKEGDLIIFCTDLEWLAGDKFLNVREALKKKGSRLHLYLKKPTHTIVKELELFGAHVHQVREDIRSEHRFSILLSNGFKSIIIRNKEYESDRIQVDEHHNNPALVNLALDMLDDCEYPIPN